MALRKRLIDGDFILDPPPTAELVNLLPFEITVIIFQGEYGKGRFQPVAKLGKYETKIIQFPGTSYETKISCTRGDEAALLTMPIYFGRKWSKYFFGACSWNSDGMDTNMYNLYADLPGLRIYNHFPFPIKVQYKNMVFNIGGNTWRGFIGGSPGVIYFDNQGQGLDVGDVFDVSLPGYGMVTQFKIPNRYIRNIHLGATSTP
jgi:hypothetical protein